MNINTMLPLYITSLFVTREMPRHVVDSAITLAGDIYVQVYAYFITLLRSCHTNTPRHATRHFTLNFDTRHGTRQEPN